MAKRDLLVLGTNLPSERGLDTTEQNGLAVAGAGLVGVALAKRGVTGLFLAGLGAGLIYRWLDSNELLGDKVLRKVLNTKNRTISEVSATLRVGRAANELYRTWRNVEQAPLFLRDIESVVKIGPSTYQWLAKIPGTNKPLRWASEIVEEVPGHRIIWRTIEGSDLHHQGIIMFEELSPIETEVVISVEYRVPAGGVGEKLATVLGGQAHDYLRESLWTFKRYVERSELPAPRKSNGHAPGAAVLTSVSKVPTDK